MSLQTANKQNPMKTVHSKKVQHDKKPILAQKKGNKCRIVH